MLKPMLPPRLPRLLAFCLISSFLVSGSNLRRSQKPAWKVPQFERPEMLRGNGRSRSVVNVPMQNMLSSNYFTSPVTPTAPATAAAKATTTDAQFDRAGDVTISSFRRASASTDSTRDSTDEESLSSTDSTDEESLSSTDSTDEEPPTDSMEEELFTDNNNEESSRDRTTRTFRRASSDKISDNDPMAITITLQCNNNRNDEDTSEASSSSCTDFKCITVTAQGGNTEEGGDDITVHRYPGSDDADGITYIVDGVDGDDDMFIKLMSPNNLVLFHTPPPEEDTNSPVNSDMPLTTLLPTVYSRDFDESEIALLTLDDAVLMAEQFIRLYRRHLERVAEDTDTLFRGSNSKEVFKSFLPAAMHLQRILGRIEEVSKKDTENLTDENDEMHQLEGAKNGFCDTFNRLSKWSHELEKQFTRKIQNMEEEQTSTTLTPVFSKREQELLDMGVESAVGPITDLLKQYAGGDDPNNPNYENNKKVLDSPEFAELLKEALTKTAQSSSSVIGLVQKAAQLENDVKDLSKEWQVDAKDWAKEMVDKIKQDVKNVDDVQNEVAAAVEVEVNDAVDGETEEIDSVSTGTPEEESPLVVVCGDHSGVSGLAPGEDQVVKSQFQSHQRKAILKSVFRSNWKSPKIIGMMDSVRFQNSLALDHADGTRTVLEANVDVNNLLKSDSSSLNIDLKATHTGKDFAIGGAARIVVAEAGLKQADVSLFATLQRDLPNGRSLRTGVFLDLALVPDKGSDPFKLRTTTVLENEQRGSRLQLDTSFTKHGDGSLTAGMGIGFQQNLGSVINSNWQNVDFTANAQMDKDWGGGGRRDKTMVSASIGLSIKF